MPAQRPHGSLYRRPMLAAGVGVGVNLLLGAGKLGGGLLGGSLALVADAVNSFGDAVVSGVVLVALAVAQTPPDVAHPYGHTRAESVAASYAALLTTLSGVLVGWGALSRLSAVSSAPEGWTLWLAAANVVVKEALYRYTTNVGRRTGSLALIANAWDHRADSLASAAVLAGLAAARFGGSALGWTDAGAALAVAGVIVVTGLAMLTRSSSELLDRQAGPDLVRRVEAAAEGIAGVHRVETLRVRKSGLEYLVDIHIEVDAMLTVREGHEIGHRVKDQLLDRFETLRDVLVHVEPARHPRM